MPVRKMIEILKTLPVDAEIYFIDTWWQSEAYGPNADTPLWNGVHEVVYNEKDNTVELY